MNPIIYFSIASFVYIIILIFVYFSKERIKSYENTIFSYMIICNFLSLFFEISSSLISDINLTRIILKKTFMSVLLIWGLIFLIYNLVITDNTKKIYNNRYFKMFVFSFCIIIIVGIFVLPLNFSCDKNGMVINTYGLSQSLFSLSFMICGILSLLILVLNIKKIKNKKYIPAIFFLILMIGMGTIQILYPRVLLINFCITIVTSLMYHTIENPDMKMIEQLEIAKNQADKANRAKTDFLSSMSHEIRTPLNAIVGFSEYIETAKTLEEAKENASDVVKASQTLLEIVNGILDISKIEAGKIEITNSNYDTHELFDSTIKLAKARLGDKNLEFRIHIAEDIPETLYGDKMNLKKVMINLLTNAIKYTDEGYFDFKVHCIKTNDVCRLIISVEDSGRGIKPEDIDKLFTKFTRMDEARNTTIEGTGLGLAITKQLVELMNGKIVVQSVYGKGSKFTVAVDQRISNEVIKEEKVIEQELDLTGYKVLVVDDNKLNLKVANKILSQYNLTVELVESGQECIDLINKGNTYDLILMDDMMPVMRGEEAMKKLRENPNFDIPVVSLTANAISGMREKYIASGFDDFLSKPIEKPELHRVLAKLVANKKTTQITKPNIEVKQPVESNNEIIDLEEKPSLDLSGKKILIVDDNKLNIKVESKVLEKYNPTIDFVLSGKECIEKIKTEHFDLILMDDMMPEMSGTETFHYLKENIPDFNTPVIMVTANAIEGMKDKYLAEGFDAYISKPIDKQLLDKELNRILKG